MSKKNLRVTCVIFGLQPSSSVRAIARAPIAERFSIEWTNINFEGDRGFSEIFRGLKHSRAILRIILIPINLIRNSKKLIESDVVYVIKYSPIWFSRIIKYFCKIIIYDFDDPMWLHEFSGAQKFKKQLICYDAFTCDNELQLNMGKIINSNGKIIQGVVPEFDICKRTQKDGIKLIWVGSQSTQRYLKTIESVLIEVLHERDFVSLTLLGANRSEFLIGHERVSFLEIYDETQMQNELCDADIGLFPVLNDELSSARGVHKANVYFAAGIPIVATSSKLIQEIIRPAVTGFICNTLDDWYNTLLRLIDDKILLLEMKSRIQNEFQSNKINNESTRELIEYFHETIRLSD